MRVFQRLSFDLISHTLQKGDARDPLFFAPVQIVDEANSFYINDNVYRVMYAVCNGIQAL